MPRPPGAARPARPCRPVRSRHPPSCYVDQYISQRSSRVRRIARRVYRRARTWTGAGLTPRMLAGPVSGPGRRRRYLSGVAMNSPGVFADLAAQRACWHPVAFASDVADRPAHADLLGEPLVVWRGADGAPRVMSDLCVHRGTALSLGWIKGDELVCAYHGWRYGADGRCVAIPQKEDPSVVPAKARVASFGVQERYGLVWVALEEPRWPLPEVPELESGDWTIVPAGPYRWQCDAGRQVENFTDFGHFPWVHPGLLGDPERPVVPRHQVQADGHVLRYEIVRPEA